MNKVFISRIDASDFDDVNDDVKHNDDVVDVGDVDNEEKKLVSRRLFVNSCEVGLLTPMFKALVECGTRKRKRLDEEEEEEEEEDNDEEEEEEEEAEEEEW